mgnify:CR=1 FL=1
MGIIYCHKNKINGKCYVGQTRKTLEKRVGPNPASSYQNNKIFSSDITEYGWGNFESSILETVDDSILNERETFWMHKMKQEGIQLYNKCLRGTSNFHKTILTCNRATEEDRIVIQKLFEEGKSLKEIGEYTSLSRFTLKGILIDLGYEIPTSGNLCSFDKEQKEVVHQFIKDLKCPICGNSFKEPHDMRCMLCSVQCRTSYLKLSVQDRNKVRAIHNDNLNEYRLLRKHLKEEKNEYIHRRIEIEKDAKERRKEVVSQRVEELHEKRKPKHTVEELYWHKDEIRCKQKLDLILSSGVDLTKFGYNAKLCRMFPELSKRTVLFLLRKYNISHFERVGSNTTNLNL